MPWPALKLLTDDELQPAAGRLTSALGAVCGETVPIMYKRTLRHNLSNVCSRCGLRLGRSLERQRTMSSRIDGHLPKALRTDGMTDFLQEICPAYLKAGQRVYDIGGGKNPYVDAATKRRLRLVVVGVDISSNELDRAPVGSYDRTVACDVGSYRGSQDADLVVSSAVLEHVQDVEGAFDALASLLTPGGHALLFVPSRNALFARLNLLLPEGVKRRALDTVRGERNASEGFPSYYRFCTPRDFRRLAEERGLVVVHERWYYVSSYFFSFVPAYLIWRGWVLACRRVDPRQSAETFSMVLRKPTTAGG